MDPTEKKSKSPLEKSISLVAITQNRFWFQTKTENLVVSSNRNHRPRLRITKITRQYTTYAAHPQNPKLEPKYERLTREKRKESQNGHWKNKAEDQLQGGRRQAAVKRKTSPPFLSLSYFRSAFCLCFILVMENESKCHSKRRRFQIPTRNKHLKPYPIKVLSDLFYTRQWTNENKCFICN